MKQSSHCLIKQFEKLPVVRNSENAAYLKSTLQFQITGGLNKRGGGGRGLKIVLGQKLQPVITKNWDCFG